MKRHAIAALAIPLGLAAVLAAPALACGEGQFIMGQGLKYQAYLAPNPAAVLVYDAGMSQASPKRRAALIEGLRASGHTVTEVADDTALARALQAGRFDVVIASYDRIGQVAAAGDSAGIAPPRLLPVVARSQRNDPGLTGRYPGFVLDGASLGQYLKAINGVLAAGVP